MGWVKDLDAVNRRSVRVAASWCADTPRSPSRSDGPLGSLDRCRVQGARVFKTDQVLEDIPGAPQAVALPGQDATK